MLEEEENKEKCRKDPCDFSHEKVTPRFPPTPATAVTVKSNYKSHLDKHRRSFLYFFIFVLLTISFYNIKDIVLVRLEKHITCVFPTDHLNTHLFVH